MERKAPKDKQGIPRIGRRQAKRAASSPRGRELRGRAGERPCSFTAASIASRFYAPGERRLRWAGGYMAGAAGRQQFTAPRNAPGKGKKERADSGAAASQAKALAGAERGEVGERSEGGPRRPCAERHIREWIKRKHTFAGRTPRGGTA